MRAAVERKSVYSSVSDDAPGYDGRYLSIHDIPNEITEKKYNVIDEMMDNILPWSCECKPKWRDLGQGYVPRHIRDNECAMTSCYHGHYRCVPKTYNVRVFKHDAQGRKNTYNSLMCGYEYETVTVVVGASCEQH